MAKMTRLMTAGILVLLLVISGINYESTKATGPRSVQLDVDMNKVMLRSATIDVRFASNLKGKQQLPTDGGYYLVHFTDRPDSDTASRFMLAVSQGNVMEYIPFSAYLCRLYNSHMEALNSMKGIDWIGSWNSEYKISPYVYETIETTSISDGMLFDGAKTPTLGTIPQPENEFIVTLFKGEDASAYIADIEALGGIVHSYTVDRIHLAIEKTKLPQIAAFNGVYFIERRYLMGTVNDNDTWIMQTYILGNRKVFANGITGAGQVVALSDTGIDMDHLMFWDSAQGLPSHTYNALQRKVVVYYNWYQTGTYYPANPPTDPYPYYDPGDGYMPIAGDPMYNVYDWDFDNPTGSNYAAGHGTHTSGTIAGEWVTGVALPTWGIVPTAGYDFYEGNAYGAKIVFQDLGRQDSPYVYTPPDLNDPTPAGTLHGVAFPGTVGLFPQAMADGAYIHSNSWGGGGYGEYSASSQDVDEMMWANPDFLIIFSNGNDGPGVMTITPPATAKDCLSIGASETTGDGYGGNSEDVAGFSSWGPTGGWGRVKPDVCAPGQVIFSAENDYQTPGASPNDGLIGYQGTSMSAPGVAGCCALIREYFTTGWYTPVGLSTGFMGGGALTPTAALMKATIIQSAEPMTGDNTGGTIPGAGQGWGRVLLDNALYLPGDTRSLLVDDDRVGLDGAAIVQPFFKAYTVCVAPGQPLDVTVVYTDPPGTAGSAFQMVNYLYVEVDHPNGMDYYLSGAGNFSNGESILNPGFIYPDTVQKVRISNPDPGLYTIFVVAFQTDQVTPGWNVQPYALTVCGNLVSTAQSYIEFDQKCYCCDPSDTATITVADGTAAGTGSINVTVTSSICADSETVALTELSGACGLFQGTVNIICCTGSPVADDGTLETDRSDTITASYGAMNAIAVIDCDPPVFSNEAFTPWCGCCGEITWDTNENADSEVHYGTTPAYGSTATDSTVTATHSVEIDGLERDTTYYYEVCSTDECGNYACSGPHTFTTPLQYCAPQYHAGYTAEFDYGTVLDDDDMWTGHNLTYAGIRHGVFQFKLTGLPCEAYITSVEVRIYKQADFLDTGQADTWSCNFIDFAGDLYLNGTYDSLHNASTLVTMSPTWTTAGLAGDASGALYSLTLADPADIAYFNPGGHAAGALTFRLDGATTGETIMSWDTGYRQDLGSLSVLYKPCLIITYDLSGVCPGEITTPVAPIPSICPLAKYNIQLVQTLKGEAEGLLAEAQDQGLDTAGIEELMAKADEFLNIAEQFCMNSTNCIAGNWNALKAMELYKQAIDELEDLLGT